MLKIILYILISACVCESIRIKTKLGDIKGTERKSRDGKTYYAFTGIPYAKPPVGKLRLKNPVALDEKWDGEFDATNEMPKCIQHQVLVGFLILGQEDCLYLSVYTPDLNPKEKLAVLVHMHGGGYRFGDGGPKSNADYLMDGNVILVNVHYRLGALGFLSAEDEHIPGNFGLKDQAMALQWLKDNIESFGGDGERITVFGVSAGGASTHYLMISPLTKGLLNGVISQSGAINQFWSYHKPGTARPLARRIAEEFGCQDKDGAELLDCLQTIDASELVKTDILFAYWYMEPLVVFRPVQEPQAEGAFMPFDPLKQESTLPWITGVTSSEGIIKHTPLMARGDSFVQEFIDHMDEYLFRVFSLDESCPQAKATVKLIKERYFPEPVNINSTLEGIKLLYGDSFFTFPMGEAIKRHKGPVYQYLYDYRSGFSFGEILIKIPSIELVSSAIKLLGLDVETTLNYLMNFFGAFSLPEFLQSSTRVNLGVCHGDDMGTLFRFDEMFPIKSTPDSEKVSKTMVQLWSNFAKYLKPTLDEDPVKWPKQSTTLE
ncbi:hypothetical protein O3M35_002154 [Rhynocoris fuscipes]|uniref:Carboxylic ester hydrolase n=1 Tax=Rhynocoris fuscipes TaxID=488301 RepID=A0AAW1CSL6_9HEMI